MKQSVKVILFSCLVGTILAGSFFLTVKNKAEAKTVPVVYAFQVGVFKSLQNAELFKNNYSNAKITKDKDDFYRVFIGVTIKNKDLFVNLFNKQQENYYLKEIQVAESIYDNLLKYDELLEKTSKESQDAIIKNMLECLPNEL